MSVNGRSSGRVQSIDILRALAVLLVIMRHTVPAPTETPVLLRQITNTLMRGGWAGVDLFFVLSGFLVSSLLFREYQEKGGISVGRFLVRRGFKIYPSFYLLLATTVVLMWYEGRSVDGRAVASEFFFVQNYWFNLCGISWSLAVEEHFYLLLVISFFWVTRKAGHANALHSVPWVFAVVAVVCLALRVITWKWLPHSPGHQVDFAPTHLRLDSLGFGVLLAYLYAYHGDTMRAFAQKYRYLLLASGVLLFVPAFTFTFEKTPFIYTLGFSLLYVGSGCLLVGLLDMKLPFPRVLQPVAFIGLNSYNIYLWHLVVEERLVPRVHLWLFNPDSWPIYLTLNLTLAVVCGIIMSQVVELPLLRLRNRWFRSHATGAVPTAGA